jgi:hypothetical protein
VQTVSAAHGTAMRIESTRLENQMEMRVAFEESVCEQRVDLINADRVVECRLEKKYIEDLCESTMVKYKTRSVIEKLKDVKGDVAKNIDAAVKKTIDQVKDVIHRAQKKLDAAKNAAAKQLAHLQQTAKDLQDAAIAAGSAAKNATEMAAAKMASDAAKVAQLVANTAAADFKRMQKEVDRVVAAVGKAVGDSYQSLVDAEKAAIAWAKRCAQDVKDKTISLANAGTKKLITAAEAALDVAQTVATTASNLVIDLGEAIRKVPKKVAGKVKDGATAVVDGVTEFRDSCDEFRVRKWNDVLQVKADIIKAKTEAILAMRTWATEKGDNAKQELIKGVILMKEVNAGAFAGLKGLSRGVGTVLVNLGGGTVHQRIVINIQLFGRFDVDRDGEISLSEWQDEMDEVAGNDVDDQALRGMFEAMDADKSSSVCQKEFMSFGDALDAVE